MDLKRYLNGYVQVRLKGDNLETFINESLKHDLALWDIRRTRRNEVKVSVPLHHLWPFIKLSRNMRCQMKIEKRGGFPFVLNRVKKRKGLLVGTALFFALAYLSTSFLWSYDIDGNERLSDGQIVKMLQSYGILPGKSMYNIDFLELQTQFLIDHDDEFSWITFARKGTQLKVKVQERDIPLSGDLRPAHLVARHDGVVKNILVMKGTAMVQKETSVKAGQTLIAGIEYHQKVRNIDGTYSPAGEPDIIRAKGVVEGEVTYDATAICPLREEILRDTGESKKQVIVMFGEKELMLKGSRSKPYDHFRRETTTKNLLHWQDYTAPLKWISTIYYEQYPTIVEYTISQAYEEATERARAKLHEQLGDDVKLIKEDIRVEQSPNSQIVQINVSWTVLENLASYQLIAK